MAHATGVIELLEPKPAELTGQDGPPVEKWRPLANLVDRVEQHALPHL